ncbi:ATPase [Niveispirillum lacus]|uniref:ATPase n=2 Tax=Niveispirillum lacus TaxID=1981099 RepID=A0A255YUP1_9PROT|nr:ATP12 family protein [Niveispirillum lacus]OYQ32956.1 ATPase [Niveispirillum lacus]
MKRFYKTVETAAAEGGFTLTLDGKPVCTPAKLPLIVPTQALADAMAAEWAAQGDEVKPATMPLTQLASTSIDGVRDRLDAVAEASAVYGESELVCYRAVEPDELIQRQASLWNPLLDWAARRYDAHLLVTSGIMHKPQPADALKALRAAVDQLDEWHLTALQNAIGITGSLLVSLALVDRHVSAEQAFELAQLDENYQIEKWGEDWEAADRRAVQRADLAHTVRFLDLLR